jgi:hypothetical protein
MAKKNRGRGLLSFLSILAVLMATSSVALAFSDKDAMGEITVSGNSDGNGSFVLLNGEKAYNGRTFISNGTIETKEAGATVKLGKLGLISLTPNTTLNLNISDNSISGTLSNGKIKVFNKKGVKVDIETFDNKISTDGAASSIFNVDLSTGATTATAESGNVFAGTGTDRTVVTPQDDDDDDDDINIVPLVLVFAGIVGVTTYFVLSNRDDDDELNTISATF